jgi:hypothetical protein
MKKMVEPINMKPGRDRIFEHMELAACHAVAMESQQRFGTGTVFVKMNLPRPGSCKNPITAIIAIMENIKKNECSISKKYRIVL